MARLRWTILPLCVALWGAACGPKTGSVPAVCAACESDGDAGLSSPDTVDVIDTPELAELAEEPGTDAGQDDGTDAGPDETAGVDVPTADTACDDGDPCTTDTGKLATGCVHEFACDDGDKCTSDYCSVTGTCSHAAASLPCSGTCTTKEVCASDLCHGKATPGNWMVEVGYAPPSLFGEADGGASLFFHEKIVRLGPTGALVKVVACPANVDCGQGMGHGRQPNGNYLLFSEVADTIVALDANYVVAWKIWLGNVPSAVDGRVASLAVGSTGTVWAGASDSDTEYCPSGVMLLQYPRMQKLAVDGSLLWTKFYQMPGQAFSSILATPDGGAAGTLSLTGQTSCSDQEAIVLRLDGDGNVLWTKSYGKHFPSGFLRRADGYYLYLESAQSTGSILRLDEAGSVLWTLAIEPKVLYGHPILSTPDGGFAIARGLISMQPPNFGRFLLYDADANLVSSGGRIDDGLYFEYADDSADPQLLVAYRHGKNGNASDVLMRLTPSVLKTGLLCGGDSSCDDGNPCTVDLALPSCVHKAVFDGIPCTLLKHCQSGVCK
jgi:hypothetical protein